MNHRRERAEQGSINDPFAFNVNQTEFAGAFNGRLGRYSLPVGGIDEPSIVQGAFSRVIVDAHTGGVDLSIQSTDWQNDDGAGNTIHDVTDTLASNAILDVEWSGGWTWSALATLQCWVQWRVTVNAVTVAQTGWISAEFEKYSAYLTAAVPALAGPLRMRVDGRIACVGTFYGGTGDKSSNQTTALFGHYASADRYPTIAARSLIATVRSR